tara:strand:+ start:1614 stop:2072 length:459 start_codon:yes stop_codon:yes gene_type:complete
MRHQPTLEARALSYLARREHSRHELERKLVTHANPPTSEALSDVLDKLEKRGFLSAERVVEQVIRMRRHKFGSQRIVQELKEKGIETHLITNALPELIETELETARAVWGKKFGVLPANIKERGKQMRFLSSRGFSSEIIRQVLQSADKAHT